MISHWDGYAYPNGGPCWNCGAIAGCFANLLGKPGGNQIVVCFGCMKEDYVLDLKGMGQQLVCREINNRNVPTCLAMELDLFRMKGRPYEVNLGSRWFRREQVEAGTFPPLLEKFNEEKFEKALTDAIIMGQITRDHISEWRFSDPEVRRKFEVVIGKKAAIAMDRELANFVINNKKFVYCQPTLDMFKGVEEAAVLFEAYAALHDKSGLPLWSSLTEQKRSEYLAAVLLLWGGPNDATPGHFDWTSAYNFTMTFDDEGQRIREPSASWLIGQPVEAAYEMMDKVVRQMARGEILPGSSAGPPPECTDAFKKRCVVWGVLP